MLPPDNQPVTVVDPCCSTANNEEAIMQAAFLYFFTLGACVLLIVGLNASDPLLDRPATPVNSGRYRGWRTGVGVGTMLTFITGLIGGFMGFKAIYESHLRTVNPEIATALAVAVSMFITAGTACVLIPLLAGVGARRGTHQDNNRAEQLEATGNNHLRNMTV